MNQIKFVVFVVVVVVVVRFIFKMTDFFIKML